MSLLPYVLTELDNLRRPVDLFDQYFGDVLGDDVYQQPMILPMLAHRHYLRPWRQQLPKHSGVSHVSDDKDGFKINLDVQQFKPEELGVKVADGYVVVKGKHEERSDEHGFIQREFTRRYKLPVDVNPDTVTSNLSSDGVLMVTAAKKALPAPEGGRAVPITQTNAPAVTAGGDSKKGEVTQGGGKKKDGKKIGQ